MLVPDFILNNKVSRGMLETVIADICHYLGIEGGEKSVCTGAVDTMADYLLPALT